MDSNFSPKVKEIISYSREEALRLGNDFIGTEHLLLGLIREGDGMALKVLQTMQVDLFELRKELELAIKDKNNKPLSNINSLPLTKQAEKVIRITVLEAKSLKSTTVETEHLMLSILKNKENVATQILHHYEIDYDRFKNELSILQGGPSADYNDPGSEEFDDDDERRQFQQQRKPAAAGSATKSKTPVLDNFGRDITK